MSKAPSIFLLAFLVQAPMHVNSDVLNLPPYKITEPRLYLTAKEAYELKKNDANNVLFVDARTRAEVEFVGMPDIIDVNIPYAFNDLKEWDNQKKRFKKKLNRNFSSALDASLKKAGLNKESKIIIMCRSGRRSALAVNLIYKFGYKNVYSVIDGFEGDKVKDGPEKGKRKLNGWKNSGLPWSYKLDKEKMYFE